MKIVKSCSFIISVSVFSLLITVSNTIADDSGRYFIKLQGGFAFLSDRDIEQFNVAAGETQVDASFDTGYAVGTAFGYYITDNWLAEVSWDYRSNDNDSIKADRNNLIDDGEFASNMFFLNGYYRFDEIGSTSVRPYLGLGLGFAQEIDIDLSSAAGTRSFSSDGEFAYQLIVGASYSFTDNWSVTSDLRYTRVNGFDMSEEDGSAQFVDVDYDPITIMLGIAYTF
jgi:outer membrane protein W